MSDEDRDVEWRRAILATLNSLDGQCTGGFVGLPERPDVILAAIYSEMPPRSERP